MSLTIRRWHVECYRRAVVKNMQPESVFPRDGEYFLVRYNPPHDERIRHERIIDSYSQPKYIYNIPLRMFR